MSDNPEGSIGRPRPDARDVHVGARLRERRMRLGMSQEHLAESVGVSFQQIQKYERGVNRMGASRLYELARVLGVPLDFFYARGDGDVPRTRPSLGWAEAGQEPFGEMSETQREAQELAHAFSRITDKQVRRRVLDLVKTLAPASNGDE